MTITPLQKRGGMSDEAYDAFIKRSVEVHKGTDTMRNTAQCSTARLNTCRSTVHSTHITHITHITHGTYTQHHTSSQDGTHPTTHSTAQSNHKTPDSSIRT